MTRLLAVLILLAGTSASAKSYIYINNNGSVSEQCYDVKASTFTQFVPEFQGLVRITKGPGYNCDGVQKTKTVMCLRMSPLSASTATWFLTEDACEKARKEDLKK